MPYKHSNITLVISFRPDYLLKKGIQFMFWRSFCRGSASEVSSDKSSVQIPSPGSSAFKEVTENRPSEAAIIVGNDAAFMVLQPNFMSKTESTVSLS